MVAGCTLPEMSYCASFSVRQVPMLPPMSFFSISEVYPPKLKTEEKRARLTLANVDKYNKALNDSGVLVPEGALYLIDVHNLTQGVAAAPATELCSPACMHARSGNAAAPLQHHTHVLQVVGYSS